MKKTVGVVAAAAVAAAVGAAAVISRPHLEPELCYVRKMGAVVGSCQCQGNEMLLNRSPRNVANFPEWGDCGAVPRPGKFMRGACELVTGPCR